MDDIASKAVAGGYTSQYEFDLALSNLVYSVKDGHTFSQPCTSGTISYLRGRNTLSLVSITKDGTSAPAVYLRSRLYHFVSGSSCLFKSDDVYAALNSFTVSSIETINGEDIDIVLTASAGAIASDPDASYNRLMWNYGAGPSAGYSSLTLHSFRLSS